MANTHSAASAVSNAGGGLANLISQQGLLPEDKLSQAQQAAASQQIPLISYLVSHGLLSAERLALALYKSFGTPLLDLAWFDLSQSPEAIITAQRRLIERHHALPLLQRGKRLFIALSDPTNFTALEEFRFSTGLMTEAILVEDDKLTRAMEELGASDGLGAALDAYIDDDLPELSLEVASQQEEDADEILSDKADDAPVVSFVNKLLLDAVRRGASDLHFEPYEKSYRVRFRTDGILTEIASPPVQMAGRIAARIKVMSSLDIAEKRLPQDGRITIRLSKTKAIDFRVSTLPTLHGEKVVMRILDSGSAMPEIDQLGYEPEQQALFSRALAEPQGMILVTGPTGSGKTVSLYTGLNILNTPERNISTAEDPVEINLTGVNQVQINPKSGLDFASALRAFLRQDPDVVMVGEIRDLETAEIAIKAAQTGHLVLSTVHTNSAAETINRLLNMGIPGYNIASSVTLIIAQRLARRLCPACKAPEQIPAQELLEAGFTPQQLAAGITPYRAVGCHQCNGGYKGRVGIYEVLPMSRTVAQLVMDNGSTLAIDDQARQESINSLRQSGLLKVIAGITSLSEISRVTRR